MKKHRNIPEEAENVPLDEEGNRGGESRLAEL
jgi:hypothetical protein